MQKCRNACFGTADVDNPIWRALVARATLVIKNAGIQNSECRNSCSGIVSVDNFYFSLEDFSLLLITNLSTYLDNSLTLLGSKAVKFTDPGKLL
jgi:hypothetical protein